MLFNKTAIHALKILSTLATGEKLRARDIADQAGTPPKYTVTLITNMAKYGYIGTKRGPGGGTFITDRSVSVREVLETLQVMTWDDDLSLGSKFDTYYEQAQTEFLQNMENITLGDLAKVDHVTAW